MKFSNTFSLFARVVALLFIIGAGVLTSPVVRAETPDEQYQFAAGLYEQKLWSLAAENLRKFLDANPNHAQAKLAAYQLGAALYRAESDKGAIDYNAAATAYEKALARYPDAKLAAAARYELGDIYYNLKKYDKAAATYSEFLKSTPAAEEAAEAQYGLAESYYELKKANEAKAAYQALLKNHPQSRPAPYAQRALGFLAEDAGDFAVAASAYKTLLERYPKSEVAPEAKLRLANALFNTKKHGEAIAAYRAALADPAAGEWRAEAALGLADAQFAAKEWSAAAASYKGALVALPASDARRSVVQLRLADSHYNAKEYEPAIAAYSPLLSDKDTKIVANALYFSAGSYFASKKFSEAAAHYKKLTEQFPQHEKAPRALLRMGDAYAEAKDAARAAEAYRALVARHPKSPEATEAGEALLALAGEAGSSEAVEQAVRGLPPGPAASNAQLRLAQIAFDKGDWNKAATLAQSVVAGKPDKASAENALYVLASSKLQSGDAKAAATTFQKQLAAHPTGKLASEAKLGLSWALLDAKQWAAAEAAARAAVAATKNSKEGDTASWARLALGQALLQTGKAKEASTLLASLENSPSKDIASQAIYDAALAFEAQKQWSEAAVRWNKYAGMATDAPSRASSHLRQGLALTKAKKSSEAIAAFDRALAADPKSDVGARALYESAWLAHDLKQSAQETERWRRLETEFPQSKYAAEAALQQGETAFDAKSWQDAAAAYRRVTEKYPQSAVAPLAWYKLGSSLYNVSDWSAAAAAFDNAAASPVKSDVALESSFWAAESWRRAGNLAQAKTRYETFLKTAGSATAPKAAGVEEFVPAARLGLGQSLLAAGDAAGAARVLNSGLPDAKGGVAAEMNFHLGEALLQQKKYKEAATQFLKVSALYKNSDLAPRAQWNAAQALEQSGDKKAATEIYKLLAAQEPANEWTAKAQEKVQE